MRKVEKLVQKWGFHRRTIDRAHNCFHPKAVYLIGGLTNSNTNLPSLYNLLICADFCNKLSPTDLNFGAFFPIDNPIQPHTTPPERQLSNVTFLISNCHRSTFAIPAL